MNPERSKFVPMNKQEQLATVDLGVIAKYLDDYKDTRNGRPTQRAIDYDLRSATVSENDGETIERAPNPYSLENEREYLKAKIGEMKNMAESVGLQVKHEFKKGDEYDELSQGDEHLFKLYVKNPELFNEYLEAVNNKGVLTDSQAGGLRTVFNSIMSRVHKLVYLQNPEYEEATLHELNGVVKYLPLIEKTLEMCEKAPNDEHIPGSGFLYEMKNFYEKLEEPYKKGYLFEHVKSQYLIERENDDAQDFLDRLNQAGATTEFLESEYEPLIDLIAQIKKNPKAHEVYEKLWKKVSDQIDYLIQNIDSRFADIDSKDSDDTYHGWSVAHREHPELYDRVEYKALLNSFRRKLDHLKPESKA